MMNWLLALQNGWWEWIQQSILAKVPSLKRNSFDRETKVIPPKNPWDVGFWGVKSSHLFYLRALKSGCHVGVSIVSGISESRGYKNTSKDTRYTRNPPKQKSLVGGFNPFEKYQSKWESSPSRGDNKQYLKPPKTKRSPRCVAWVASVATLLHRVANISWGERFAVGSNCGYGATWMSCWKLGSMVRINGL